MSDTGEQPGSMAAPPIDAPIGIERHDHGTTIRLARLGVLASNPDLVWQAPLAFGLWLVVSMLVLGSGSAGGALFFVLLLPLLIVPVTWLVLNLHRGVQEAVIDVVDDTLVVSLYGVFGLEQDEWHRHRLRHVCVARVPSPGANLLGRPPVWELQLITRRGNVRSYLAGRDEAELRWLAQVLGELLELDRDGRRGQVDRPPLT
ncbi:MAG: hypothetical protein WD118_07500 [Phycisphaeraceae bacterium]